MFDKIQLLPDALANQIAAGEVVQRPASAVKELLENAIDAGATTIKLLVKDAGKTLLQVIDNGTGMSETDARLCFERHATSKIKSVEDLFAIQTLGFRGEALASIAAIAQVELKTRLRGQELGTRILIEGMQVKKQEPCQCPEGTSIAVKNLFFNVPARRNFLKSDQIEIRHIIDEFQHVVLANPNVSFTLHHNDNELYNLPNTSLRKRISSILGNNIGDKLVAIEENTDLVRIHGFVAQPDLIRKSRGEQYLFVNERFIKSAYIHHAISTAYDQLLPEKSYPIYALYLDIDPKRIDINVHPTKQEIKFDDERIIYSFILAAVKRALATHCLVPSLDFSQDDSADLALLRYKKNSPETNHSDNNTPKHFNPFDNNSQYGKSGSKFDKIDISQPNNPSIFEQQRHKNPIPNNWRDLYDIAANSQNETTNSDNTNDDHEINPETITIRSNFGEQQSKLFPHHSDTPHKDLAEANLYQLHNAYILSPIKSGYILIDQQAAHERVLFERYQKLQLQNPITGQRLLFPQTIVLPRADALLLNDIMPDLNMLGYDLAAFGQNTFVIHAKPADIPDTDTEQTAMERLIEQYKLHNGGDIQNDRTSRIARTLARHHAIKTGRKLNKSEMQSLLDQLFACETPFVAPNGKPTFIKYQLSDIEKQFGR
jgi:DNA mismatch repair protein MutL